MDYVDLLGDPAYRHLLLNHIPIIGLIVAFLVLATGLALRQSTVQFLGLILVALTAGASIPVASYGDAAYPTIYDTLDGAGQKWLDHHAELAETWLPVLVASAVLAILAIIVGVLRRALLPWAVLLVALVTLAGIGGVSIVARAGGQIQHPEFRVGEPPVMQAGTHGSAMRVPVPVQRSRALSNLENGWGSAVLCGGEAGRSYRAC